MSKKFSHDKFRKNLQRFKKNPSTPTEGFLNCVDYINSHIDVLEIDFDSFTMEELESAEHHFSALIPNSEEDFATENAGNVFYEAFRLDYTHSCLSKNKDKLYTVQDDFI